MPKDASDTSFTTLQPAQEIDVPITVDKTKQKKPTTRLPRPQSQQVSHSMSHEPSQVSKPPPAKAQPKSPHHRRRRTLDEELKRAGDHLWEQDDEADDDILGHGMLLGVGTKNMHGAFLARGGGAGPPVVMGVGYVEGAKDPRRQQTMAS